MTISISTLVFHFFSLISELEIMTENLINYNDGFFVGFDEFLKEMKLIAYQYLLRHASNSLF